MKTRRPNKELTVRRGKVEIQNQDSHFSTAQISLRRKEKGRLHKTLDAPEARAPSWAGGCARGARRRRTSSGSDCCEATSEGRGIPTRLLPRKKQAPPSIRL